MEEYVARHPEAAELLRKVLASLQVLEWSHSGGEATAASGGLTAGVLGDFRLLREVGRGGMGIVYEAEQISLARRVALKVLPFAATMDARQLQRFQNEARAAAGLHHPNIVPVYAVGCERGVHYYAMQFIDGWNLARVIAQRSAGTGGQSSEPIGLPRADTRPLAHLSTERPAKGPEHFHALARLGIQAAEALEYAHSLGIVHRDIKPANLMLDGTGKLWVTDFGLARTAADAGLTMTGDILGTLRYMSPEQALAKHGLVDHRTDIYALGATLYELLTGQPAVVGKDHQEILNRITFDEPQPPRALNPQIPVDLSSVVMKALAKESAERYATAQEMADDLARFLNGKPTKAQPMTWRLLVWGWLTQPERVREAGIFTLLPNAALFLWCLTALIGLAVGIWPVPRPFELVRNTSIQEAIHISYVLLGYYIARRKVAAAWLGLLLTVGVIGDAAVVVFVFNLPNYDWGGMFTFTDPGMTYCYNSLFQLLMLAQLAAFVIAVLGFYAPRNRLRWLRS